MKNKKLKIAYVTSEVKPLSHTGGLADVSFALPHSLARENIDICVFTPQYKSVTNSPYEIKTAISNLEAPILNYNRPFSLNKTCINNGPPIYLIENNELFNRSGLYYNDEGDYPDNAERFIFFCKAVLYSLKELGFQPDIIHCNDWQSALIPVYLKELYNEDPFWNNTKTLYTIHNIGYQGVFWHFDMPLTGLSWDLFTIQGIEFYGKINFMKGGIVFSDKISTVSKKYAQEIQTEQYGAGLDGIIRFYNNKLTGILNGVDYNEWNPETDSKIQTNYNIKTIKKKIECKKNLLSQFSIKENPEKPLIGMISRLTVQKGIDFLIPCLEKLLSKEQINFILLGSGDTSYEESLQNLQARFPNSFGLKIGYDFELSHKITAGADIYVMPSLYEPCGLNQMYSLKYGTIPVVRATGGLDDTIESVSLKNESISGNGFKFSQTSSEDIISSIEEALSYYENKKYWNQIIKNAMECDFSWEHQGKEYINLYQNLRDSK